MEEDEIYPGYELPEATVTAKDLSYIKLIVIGALSALGIVFLLKAEED